MNACNVYLNGKHFMNIGFNNEIGAHLSILSNYITVKDYLYPCVDRVSDSIYCILSTYDPNIYPISYFVRNNSELISFDMQQRWNEIGIPAFCINVCINSTFYKLNPRKSFWFKLRNKHESEDEVIPNDNNESEDESCSDEESNSE
jgi:hypothetical protein